MIIGFSILDFQLHFLILPTSTKDRAINSGDMTRRQREQINPTSKQKLYDMVDEVCSRTATYVIINLAVN